MTEQRHSPAIFKPSETTTNYLIGCRRQNSLLICIGFNFSQLFSLTSPNSLVYVTIACLQQKLMERRTSLRSFRCHVISSVNHVTQSMPLRPLNTHTITTKLCVLEWSSPQTLSWSQSKGSLHLGTLLEGHQSPGAPHCLETPADQGIWCYYL